ncbi:hypothetical protein [Bifidobacterium sp. ESL0790]|uniref:hypothetical protein n=1 Tax=Bifidobacterium sp. ESL0790 TaxID=2983233 RepID=UPI0023F99F39|nr:hypothetical protein [Bifidobacterium sp. ESL0790]WEV72235.1 hypothetical protein OZY47_07325 [Bifidobacterium sp. ESL0790]
MKGEKDNTNEFTSGIGDLIKSAHHNSLLHTIVEYAVKGMVFGSFAFALAELIVPNWLPITHWSMATMLIVDILLGEITLGFFRSDLPWIVIVPAHCVLTLIISIGWIFVNNWQAQVFHKDLWLFIAIYVAGYVCVWLGLLLYSMCITATMNKKLNKFNKNEATDMDDTTGDAADTDINL